MLELVKKGRVEVKESTELAKNIRLAGKLDFVSLSHENLPLEDASKIWKKQNATNMDPDIYLPIDNVQQLSQDLTLSDAEVVDIKRAVVQAEQRLEKQRKEVMKREQ